MRLLHTCHHEILHSGYPHSDRSYRNDQCHDNTDATTEKHHMIRMMEHKRQYPLYDIQILRQRYLPLIHLMYRSDHFCYQVCTGDKQLQINSHRNFLTLIQATLPDCNLNWLLHCLLLEVMWCKSDHQWKDYIVGTTVLSFKITVLVSVKDFAYLFVTYLGVLYCKRPSLPLALPKNN